VLRSKADIVQGKGGRENKERGAAKDEGREKMKRAAGPCRVRHAQPRHGSRLQKCIPRRVEYDSREEDFRSPLCVVVSRLIYCITISLTTVRWDDFCRANVEH
jgi:hypothetical protein